MTRVFCSRMFDYALIFLPEEWGGGGGLNDVLAAPQLIKLEQDSTFRTGFSQLSHSFLTDPGQADFTSHRFLTHLSQKPLTAFLQISHRRNQFDDSQ